MNDNSHPEILDCKAGEFAPLARSILERGFTLRFRARGFSMQPQIYDGDVLYVKSVCKNRVRRGDILLIEIPFEKVVMHRLIGFVCKNGEKYLLTKGDAVDFFDAEVPQSALMGRLAAIDRGGRYVRVDGFVRRLIVFIRVHPVFIKIKNLFRRKTALFRK